MPHPILIAEDDENDVILLKRAFAKANIVNPIVVLRNGEEVIQYLGAIGSKTGTEAALPALLLLDLKMPKLDGLDTLQWIRSHKPFNRLIVIVLSSSRERKDVNRAYDLHANSFLTKPNSFEKSIELVISLHDYWLSWNEPPDCSAQTSTLSDLGDSRNRRGR